MINNTKKLLSTALVATSLLTTVSNADILGAIGVFLVILVVGFWYEWRKGIFRWN